MADPPFCRPPSSSCSFMPRLPPVPPEFQRGFFQVGIWVFRVGSRKSHIRVLARCRTRGLRFGTSQVGTPCTYHICGCSKRRRRSLLRRFAARTCSTGHRVVTLYGGSYPSLVLLEQQEALIAIRSCAGPYTELINLGPIWYRCDKRNLIKMRKADLGRSKAGLRSDQLQALQYKLV